MTAAMFTNGAPLPVPDVDATEFAKMLREQYRFSYTDITRIMAMYHGQYYSEGTWRRRLRMAGTPRKAHGFGGCRGKLAA